MPAPAAPAQLNFVSSLFTSKIFLAQVVTVAASVASAAGIKILDDPAMQQQLILLLDALATALLRWQFPTGPVSVTGPASSPGAVDVPAGASVVKVWPAEASGMSMPAIVQALPSGIHTVDATRMVPAITPAR